MSEEGKAPKEKASKKPAKKAAKSTKRGRPAPAKKAATKRPAKKAAAKKTARKPELAKKAVTKRAAKKTARAPAKRRGKKAGPQYAYLLQQPVLDNGSATGEYTTGAMQGPFKTESDALDDAGVMSEADTRVVLFRELKSGNIQKSTKFVKSR